MSARARRLLTVFLSLGLLFSSVVRAENPPQEDPEDKDVGSEWKLIRDDKARNIKAYLRKDSNYRLTVNRLEAVIDAPLSTLVAAVLDTENMVHWIWRLREAKVVKQSAPNDEYLYFVINGPYGVDDRDSIIRARVVQDPKPRL